jgi:hypothetical protein
MSGNTFRLSIGVGLVVLLVSLPAASEARSVHADNSNSQAHGQSPGQQVPVSVSVPSVSGSTVAGQTLSASTGTWSGVGLSFAYQWLRCDSTGNGCSSVAGATQSSYLLASGDVGHTLGVAVTASNKNGSATATSAATAVVAPAPAPAPTLAPANTALPVVSGTAVVGQSLSASTGGWSGSPSGYAYQWRRCDSAGANCANVSGATSQTYLLASADQGATARVVVTASNSGGSSTATSAASAVVASAPAGSISYPASFFTGPAGTGNILPTKQGAFVGIWPGKSEAFADQTQHILNENAYLGRKLDIYHIHYGMWSPFTCFVTSGATDYQPVVSGKENWAVNNGMIPLVSWTPDYYVDQIIAGQADACLISFAQRYAAWGKRFMLRMYWEFNGTWEKWSKNSNGTLATAAQQQAMWRHTVDVMRGAGMTNASWVWSPDEGGYGKSFDIAPASYPGDNYVDWIASDAYNWNQPGAWCGTWCSFSDIFHHGQTGTSATGWEVFSRGRKPYMVAETGTMEDPTMPGHKGQWFTAARDAIKSGFPDLYAIVYTDVDYSSIVGQPDWALNTSTTSMDGYKAFANDPYFNTR